eukprot:399686_1
MSTIYVILYFIITYIPIIIGCNSDLDCSLNGICNKTSLLCICDDQWYGKYCDLLNIIPTIKNNGYKQLNYSSWGGSIIYDKLTQTYNMFVARMSMHCGLTTWTTNSQIVHAISLNNNPLGPYTFNKILINTFSHNPSIYNFNNTYYLYHIGCGHNTTIPIQGCINGTTPKNILNKININSDQCDGPHWTGVIYSNNNNINNNKWMNGLNEITLITNHSKNYTTNPAPLFLNDINNTIYFVYRQPAALWPYVYPPNATSERLGMSISYNNKYDGPFIDLTPYQPIANFPLEDPYLWKDFRNNFHMITHKKKPNYGPNDGSGGHLFSIDGIHWNISRNSPYNNTIIYNDGTFEQVTSRQRPQLVIENGRVKYVSNGVTYSHNTGDYTFTIVQPVYWTNY